MHLVKDQPLAHLFDFSTFACSLGIAALVIVFVLHLFLCQSIDGTGILTMCSQECTCWKCLVLGWAVRP